MKVWVALTEIGLFLNILHAVRSLVERLSKSKPELPDLTDTLAFVIYLVVMIYLIMVVVSYKTEIESRSNAKSLPFQVVFLWCPSNLLGRWFYIKFSFKVVPKVAASAPAVDIASLRREWKKANVSDIKYQPFKWAGGQCCVHSWFINLFVLNWTRKMFGLFLDLAKINSHVLNKRNLYIWQTD